MQESGLSQIGYSYDANGNRLTRTATTSSSYNYTPASNRLTAINNKKVQLDAAGNTVSDWQGRRRFEYNQRGQLSKVYLQNSVVASYTYNAFGQRTRKNIQGATVVYHYDLNGTLLSENQANNIQQVDYVGFDNRPLAQLKSQATPNGKKLITSEVVYLHTDHLNTPRTGTDTTGKVVWNWQSDAFGIKIPVAKQPNKVVVNLRFPGQYFDTESGLYYNYHRYYDPQTGRYISSDPIGLVGGLNTYGYVGGNPLRYTDSKGLIAGVDDATAVALCTANSVVCGIVGVATVVNIYCASNPTACQKIVKACVDSITTMLNEEGDIELDPKRKYTKKDREKLKDNAGGKCEYCGEDVTMESGSGKSMEGDHIDSWAGGGLTDEENGASACRDCNRTKGKKHLGTGEGEFNPSNPNSRIKNKMGI